MPCGGFPIMHAAPRMERETSHGILNTFVLSWHASNLLFILMGSSTDLMTVPPLRPEYAFTCTSGRLVSDQASCRTSVPLAFIPSSTPITKDVNGGGNANILMGRLFAPGANIKQSGSSAAQLPSTSQATTQPRPAASTVAEGTAEREAKGKGIAVGGADKAAASGTKGPMCQNTCATVREMSICIILKFLGTVALALTPLKSDR